MKTSILLSLSILLSFFSGICQSVSCPPNIDFEQGGYSYWKFYTGTCCPINTPTLSGPIANRHVLTNGNAVDPYGFFPIVSPGGGVYSLKLGNNNTGAEAERARYYVHVPSGVNNYSLIYQYAVVFEDPGHAPAEQPRFEVAAYDSATNSPVPCAQYTYVSGSNLPGFQLCTLATANPVYYKPWSMATLNLSGLAGHTVIVDFSSGDCSLQGHFGYGYIDISCGLFQVQSVLCNSSPTLTMTAPPGFANYAWYDSSYTTLVGNGASVTIPSPPQNTQYNLVLTPYAGFGCQDTLHTLVTVANISLTASQDTTVCKYSSLPLSATASGTNSVYSYSWLPSSNLSCSTCNNPVMNALSSNSYTVTAMDQFGCVSKDTIDVNVLDQDSTTVINICNGGSYNGYTTSGIYTDTAMAVNGCDSVHFLYLTITLPDTTNLSVTICGGSSYLGHTTSGNYIDHYTNQYGCDSVSILNLTVLPMSASSQTHTMCQGYMYNGHTSSGVYLDTFTNSMGCDSICTLYLTVLPPPVSNYSAVICSGQSYFGYTSTGIYIDTLQNAVGCDSVRILQLTVMPPDTTVLYQAICQGGQYQGHSQPGIYFDHFTTLSGCDSVRILHLQVNPAYLIHDTVMKCRNENINYHGQSIPTNGSYTLNWQTSSGCDSIILLQVNDYPELPPALPESTSVCSGEVVDFGLQNFVSYVWSTGETSPGIQISTPGLYWVQVTDSHGCVYRDSSWISLYDKPHVRITGTEQEICRQDVLALKGIGCESYEWYLNDFFHPIGVNDTITLSLSASATVILKGRDKNQCQAIDSVKIGLIDCCEDVIMPNAFSPNHDGVNDEFKPVNKFRANEYLFQVYNRWGEKVFEIKNTNFGWDGNYKGEPCEIGTYYYLINVDCGDGRKYIRKGDLSLLR